MGNATERDETQAPTQMGLWYLIREDYVAHFRNWHSPGFRTLAVHRFGNWRKRFASPLVRKPLGVLYWWLYRRVCDRYGIEIPWTARVGRRVVISHRNCIIVHENAEIGDECFLRQGVTIGRRDIDENVAPKIGRRVQIGAGAKILGGIVVGDGAKIGANAVVLSDVPPGATVVGVPARVVQKADGE